MTPPVTSAGMVVPTVTPFAPTACFALVALPEPGLMSRVLEHFAKRNLIPTRWHAAVLAPSDLTIDIQVAGLEWPLAEQIAAALRQIVGVDQVLLSRKVAALG